MAAAAAAISRVDDAGGRLVSVEEKFDTGTPTGKFALHMILALAQLEVDRIRDTWARAQDRPSTGASTSPAGYRRAIAGGPTAGWSQSTAPRLRSPTCSGGERQARRGERARRHPRSRRDRRAIRRHGVRTDRCRAERDRESRVHRPGTFRAAPQGRRPSRAGLEGRMACGAADPANRLAAPLAQRRALGRPSPMRRLQIRHEARHDLQPRGEPAPVPVPGRACRGALPHADERPRTRC